jgi:multidrug efflux pump subunit AcrB
VLSITACRLRSTRASRRRRSPLPPYPGASAKTLEDTVTQIIEQRMTGLDGLRYIASTSDGAGSATITLTFDAAVNPTSRRCRCRTSQTGRVAAAQGAAGVTVTKSVRNFIMVVGFVPTTLR